MLLVLNKQLNTFKLTPQILNNSHCLVSCRDLFGERAGIYLDQRDFSANLSVPKHRTNGKSMELYPLYRYRIARTVFGFEGIK